ncbi:hypothetical protein Dimus_034365 [Dionaea muscipula]
MLYLPLCLKGKGKGEKKPAEACSTTSQTSLTQPQFHTELQKVNYLLEFSFSHIAIALSLAYIAVFVLLVILKDSAFRSLYCFVSASHSHLKGRDKIRICRCLIYRSMAAPTPGSCKCGLQVPLVLLCFFSLSFLLSNSVLSLKFELHSKDSVEMKTIMSSKLVLGSRPPRCVNRCMSCRPCMAVLVIPPHRNRKPSSSDSLKTTPQDDEGYYLLSWKCRCKNKFFQP